MADSVGDQSLPFEVGALYNRPSLVFRRRPPPTSDASSIFIKIIAAALLILSAVGISAHFKQQKRAAQEQVAQAQADQQARSLALHAARQQTEREMQRTLQLQQAAQSQRAVHRCVDPYGNTSIQSAPCAGAESQSWARAVPVETQLQASLRQQEWNRQQGEARLRQEQARFAAAIGGASGPAYNTMPSSDQASGRARCQAQKNYRDAVLRQAGLNRSFDLIRRLDDQVYEACKGTWATEAIT